MSATLENRVAAFIADHPDSTFQDVRRAIHGREKTLRDILGGPNFESRPRARHGADRALVYRLRGSLSGQRPEASQRTHKEKVLALLRDGRPHSHMEGYRLNVMLHSRVADLRRDGYTIECYREGELYYYRLVGGLLGAGRGEAESPLPAPSSRPLAERGSSELGLMPNPPLSASGQTPPELDALLTDSTSGCSIADEESAASGAEAIGRELNGQLTFATAEFRKGQVAA